MYLNSPPFHSARTGYEHNPIDPVSDCREALASLFNIQQPNRVIFTSSATEALCLAIFGLDLQGSHVITTSIEHNSVLRPLKHLEKEGKIELTIIDCVSDGCLNIQNLIRSIKKNTGAIIVNHCSNVTGTVTNLSEIGVIADDRNIVLVVDASQSAGCVSIDVEKTPIHLLAFTGHKFLYGTQGIGGLYISENIHLKPLKVGGTGIKSDLLYQPETLPEYYEAGTPNLPGIVSLLAGVSYIKKVGLKTIRKRIDTHISRLIGYFEKNKKIITYYPKEIEDVPSMLSFNIQGVSPQDVGYILESSFGIVSRSGLHCAPLAHKTLGSYPSGTVRVSPSHLTSDDEIETLIDAINKICETQA